MQKFPKPHEKAKKSDPKIGEIELVSDAWPRFEKFIREIAKAGPQHRVSTAKPAKANPKALAPKKTRTSDKRARY